MTGMPRKSTEGLESHPLKLSYECETSGPLPVAPRETTNGRKREESPASHDATSVWLTTFLKALRWSGHEAGSIRDELDSHVLERTRDLMLSGMSEDSAVHQALCELGDAAGLAHRFRLTRTLPFRRFMMNATIFFGTGAALALSILAVSSRPIAQQPDPSTASKPVTGLTEVERSVGRDVNIYPLKYVDAATLASQLQTHLMTLNVPAGKGALDPARPAQDDAGGASITYDARTNSLIVAAIPESGKLIRSWIATHDVKVARAHADDANELKIAAPARTPKLEDSPFSSKDAQSEPDNKFVLSTYTPEPRLPAEIGQRQVSGSLKDVSLADAFKFFGETMGMQLFVHWADLEPLGITAETGLSIEAKDVPITTLLDIIESQINTNDSSFQLAARVDKQRIELATEAFFDRRETVLISYDLTPLGDRVSDESVSKIINTFVEPKDWKDNGGTKAELTVAGRTMFVKAPRRFHRQIEWLLKQLVTTDVSQAK